MEKKRAARLNPRIFGGCKSDEKSIKKGMEKVRCKSDEIRRKSDGKKEINSRSLGKEERGKSVFLEKG